MSVSRKDSMSDIEIEEYAIVICPQCHGKFKLVWDADAGEVETLRIAFCPSGGVYNVVVKCQHCDYEQEL
jgi:hypothetical protein